MFCGLEQKERDNFSYVSGQEEKTDLSRMTQSVTLEVVWLSWAPGKRKGIKSLNNCKAAIFFSCFLGLHLLHMEVPRPGVCSCQPPPQPQQLGFWAASVTYTTAHGNAASLTHWARPRDQTCNLMDSVLLRHDGNSKAAIMDMASCLSILSKVR